MASLQNDMDAVRDTAKTQDTDFTIVIDGFSFEVHSAVISKASRFFDRACHGQFIEASQRRVLLHDDDPWMIARLVQFFYVGKFDYRQTVKTNHSFSSLRYLMKKANKDDLPMPNTIASQKHYDIAYIMFNIADMYGIPDLRREVASMLSNELKEDMNKEVAFPTRFEEVSKLLRDYFVEFPTIHEELGDTLFAFAQQHPRSRTTLFHIRVDNMLRMHVHWATRLSRGFAELCAHAEQDAKAAQDRVADLEREVRDLKARISSQSEQATMLRDGYEELQARLRQCEGSNGVSRHLGT